jgi:hypothetical protein
MSRALGRLGDEQQALIYMKFFLDMNNTDIAQALDMSPSNVGVVIHRAVKRLRELMTSKVNPACSPKGAKPEISSIEALHRGTNHAAAAH